MLGTGLNAAADRTGAESVLRRAQERHPRDVWINYELGSVLENLSHADEAIRFYTAARAIRPETAHKLAHALEKRGNSEEAIAVFRDLKELRPGNAQNLECLGDLLKDKGWSQEAGETFEAALAARREAVRLNPEDAHAQLHLANVLKRQGKLDEAIAVLREAIRFKPDDAVSHHKLGDFLKEQHKLDEALSAHREAIRLKPDYAEAHGQVGSILADQGKLDEAIAVLRTAIQLKPDDASAHRNLGIVLCDRKRDYPAAEAAFRTAIRLKPDYAEAHHDLGIALLGQGKHDEAIAALRESVRLKPDAFAHYHLGNALNGQGKHDEAIAEWRAAIRLKPDDAFAHRNLGAVLCDVKRDYPAAEAAFRTAIRLKPDYAEAHHDLGIALLGQGKHDEAIAALRESVRLKPDNAEVHNGLGIVLCDGKHEYAAAEIEFRAAIRLQPDDAKAHYNLGNALGGQGKRDEAAAEFRESIRLKPENAEAHVSLGAFLCDVKRDYPAAEAAFREAIRFKPDLVQAHTNLGVALKARGKLEEALTSFRRAGELAPPGSSLAQDMSSWIPQLENEIAQSARLSATLKGKEGSIASRSREPLTIGDQAPAISVSKWIKGDPVDRLDPKKTYVVEFWATWCGPCRVSIPHLTELQKKYKDKGVTFLGVSVWEQDQDAVAPFVKEMGDKMNYTVAMDEVPKGDRGNKGKIGTDHKKGAICDHLGSSATGVFRLVLFPQNRARVVSFFVLFRARRESAECDHVVGRELLVR